MPVDVLKKGALGQSFVANFKSAKAPASRSKSTLLKFPDVESAVSSIRPELPLYCLHPQRIEKSAKAFLSGFPGRTLYAVKSNPDPYVLTKLYSSGITSFDVASIKEVQQIQHMFPDAFIAFMHTVKSRETIRSAYFDYGIRVFALDCFDELEKIKQETGNASDLTLFVRLDMPKGSALHPLSNKFGASLDAAPSLLKATQFVAQKVGLTFHVGSQTLDPTSYADALSKCHDVMINSDVPLDILDVGGGFPIQGLSDKVPPLANFFDVIRQGIKKINLPDACHVWGEPGLALSGESTVLVLRVVLRKDDALYLNDGGYGALFDLCWLKRKNEVSLIKAENNPPASAKQKAFRFFGPTCDSVDQIQGPFMLPENTQEGDWIAVQDMGAYSFALQTGFNGFYSDQKVEISSDALAKVVRLQRKKKLV